jgi:hypothetical protein
MALESSTQWLAQAKSSSHPEPIFITEHREANIIKVPKLVLTQSVQSNRYLPLDLMHAATWKMLLQPSLLWVPQGALFFWESSLKATLHFSHHKYFECFTNGFMIQHSVGLLLDNHVTPLQYAMSISSEKCEVQSYLQNIVKFSSILYYSILWASRD